MRFETIWIQFSQTFFQTDLIPSLVELGLCFEHENDKESFKESFFEDEASRTLRSAKWGAALSQ